MALMLPYLTITPGYIGGNPATSAVTLDVGGAARIALSEKKKKPYSTYLPLYRQLTLAMALPISRWNNIVYSYQGNFVGNVVANAFVTSSDRRAR